MTEKESSPSLIVHHPRHGYGLLWTVELDIGRVYFPGADPLHPYRPIRLSALDQLDVEFDCINDGQPDRVPRIELLPASEHTYPASFRRAQYFQKIERNLFQETRTVKAWIEGIKGNGRWAWVNKPFIEHHHRDLDPTPGAHDLNRLSQFALMQTEHTWHRDAGLIGRGTGSSGGDDEVNAAIQAGLNVYNLRSMRSLGMTGTPNEADAIEAHNIAKVARDLHASGEDISKIAAWRLVFILCGQTVEFFQEFADLSERYIQVVDRHIGKWWKGSLYPRPVSGFVVPLLPKRRPRAGWSTEIVKRALRMELIPAE